MSHECAVATECSAAVDTFGFTCPNGTFRPGMNQSDTLLPSGVLRECPRALMLRKMLSCGDRLPPNTVLLRVLEDIVDTQQLATRLIDQHSSDTRLTPMALRHGRDLRAALRLVLDRLQSVLNDHDVRPIGALRGDAIDLHIHEVIGRVVNDDATQHGRVHSLLEPGARIGSDGPVLRRSLISVSARSNTTQG